MIGIIGAMRAEVAAIKEKMTDTVSERVGSVEYVSGRLYGKDIVVAECGIGKVFAAMCAQAMILRYRPDIVINTGVAGTLTHSLSIGDIAIADRLVQHDMDTSALGDPVGLVSGINKIYFEADGEAVSLVSDITRDMGVKSVCGTVASGDCFINDREKKSRIVDTFGAMACEMEGAAIAQVCYVNNTPFAVIRAISDDASGEKQTEYTTFLQDAASKSISILEQFINKY
jgi:adenosylhomocysteine nucleosidase